MEKEQAYRLAKKLILSQEKHQDYTRVVKLAERYRQLITGEELDKLLIRYVPRESVEAFEQRLNITQSITPAIASSLMKPFNKVLHISKVKKRHDFKDEAKNEQISGMIKGFYGSKLNDQRGLDHWLDSRFYYLSFYDPNAWIVTDWAAKPQGEALEPHPFEISAADAWHYNYSNQELRWLFVHEDITVQYLKDNGEIEERSGHKYTLYEEDNTIVFCQVCRKMLLSEGVQLSDWETELQQISDTDYLVSFYEPGLGYIPHVRVGYIQDGVTNLRTFVNPFHSAMPFFMKSIKVVSEHDLSMTQHAFPQKLQYVEKCEGVSKAKKCHGGYVNGTLDKCESCGGRGYKYHTSAQDAILLPMPDNKEQMIDLNGLLVYKTPPIDLLKFQAEVIDEYKVQAHLTVYNSPMFLQASIKTATEVQTNVDEVSEVIRPYCNHVSMAYRVQVYTFARLSLIEDPDEFEIVHKFPVDLKLKTMTMLLGELKLANDSGAPSFLRDAINDDIANVIYDGDEYGSIKYFVKKKFFPFTGKSDDEVASLMSSEFVSKFDKVLYANFESIFTDIELSYPEFWGMQSINRQWAIVEEITGTYMEQIGSGSPVLNLQVAPDTTGISEDDLDDDIGAGVDDDIDSTENKDITIIETIKD